MCGVASMTCVRELPGISHGGHLARSLFLTRGNVPHLLQALLAAVGAQVELQQPKVNGAAHNPDQQHGAGGPCKQECQQNSKFEGIKVTAF